MSDPKALETLVDSVWRYYQSEAKRLTLETERQRREIVTLRQDLAAALTQYVRASIVIQNLGRYQVAHAAALGAQNLTDFDARALTAAREELDLKIALDNWPSHELGTPSEILDRITLLNLPLPEQP